MSFEEYDPEQCNASIPPPLYLTSLPSSLILLPYSGRHNVDRPHLPTTAQ